VETEYSRLLRELWDERGAVRKRSSDCWRGTYETKIRGSEERKDPVVVEFEGEK
jgi:hypothetical protein